ncbi:MAG: hypothetical protein M1830_009068 [Pleopsidium flavum]|nr:MAG: hypothetical protein M1830_009068 [Pleopsidium flavum]
MTSARLSHSGQSTSDSPLQSDSTRGTTGESSSGGGDDGSAGGSKRRRAPKSVTPNACTNCKKAKAKCDGMKPICSRCRSRKGEGTCRYEVHVNTAKEEMVREIRDLREKNDWVERILRALRSDKASKEVIDCLRQGESYQSIAEGLRQGILADVLSGSPTAGRQLSEAFVDFEMNAASDQSLGAGMYLKDGTRWTNVTTDDTLVDHLLALYFTWLHPVHMVFSEVHFMASYTNRSNIYCSMPMVNAVCAMACRFFDHAPEYDTETPIDPQILGNRFMAEARSHITPDIYHKLTTLQTLAVMFLVDLSAGNGSRASSYIRLAADQLNARLDSQYSTEASEMASWGLYALNVIWAAHTYQVPSIDRLSSSDVFQNVHMEWHDDLQHFYQHTGNFSPSVQPNSAMSTAKEHAKFCRILHDTTSIFYDGHGMKISPGVVLHQYTRYLTWKEELPLNLALADGNSQPLPHVLSLHIQYHAAIVRLFRPFLGLDQLHVPARNRLREVAVENATKGLETLDAYRKLYTCRYQLPFQTFCLLQMCDLLIRFSPAQPPATDVVHFCLETLKESSDGSGGFTICGPLQEMFRQSAVECGIPLPEDLHDLMGSSSQYTLDNLLDAYTRVSYVQPVAQITDKLETTFTQDWDEEWQRLVETSPSAGKRESVRSDKSMQITSLLN